MLFVGLVGSLPFYVQAQERLTGSARLTALENLPCLQEGTYIQQVSTHDRSGRNSDGWFGAYSYLYQDEAGEYVLMDDVGAGCIYRMWATYYTAAGNGTNRFRIYFDDETVPRIDTTLGTFFSGTNAPFLFPLTGDYDISSGGYYSYVPLSYAKRCKVTVSGVQRPFYYNFTYHRYDSSDGIQTWTGNEDLTTAMQVWNSIGTNPCEYSDAPGIVQGVANIPALDTVTLFTQPGAGTVSVLKVNPAEASTNLLTNVWVQMTWDGAAEPQVYAPLGEFFGSGLGEMEMQSLPIGMSSTNPYYCYFPMPFWSNATIRLENKGASAVSNIAYEVHTVSNTYDRIRTGYFYASASRKDLTSADRDYVILDQSGRGHLVGCVLTMRCAEATRTFGMYYLEGDERVYIDGNLSPSIYGTGTEDYFNGGWYFKKGSFCRACHGAPYLHHDDPGNNTTLAYRFHLSDIIPFRTHIRFGIEHGDCFYSANLAGTYSSVAYFYMQPVSGLTLSAELDVGNASSEQAFQYGAVGSTAVTNAWCYEGVNDDAFISDEGNQISGSCSFTVPVAESTLGAVLRRRTDQGMAPQSGEVFVDGTSVGMWSLVDTNFSAVDQRWVDSEFYIPWPYTAGKTNLNIRIEPVGNSWNEYQYRVYSVTPLSPSSDMDADGLPDCWEGRYYADIRTAHPEDDSDGDGQSVEEEWIAGSDPVDPDSFFRINISAGRTLSWLTVSNRLYSVYWTPDLHQDFQLIGNGIPWTQNGFTDTNASIGQTGFYRVEVRAEP